MEDKNFSDVRLLILDVDGVLTDGKVYVGDNGEFFKSYSVIDGYGIVSAIKKGLEIAVITGGTSHNVLIRCEFLGIKKVYMGREDKLEVYEKELKPVLGVEDSETAFIGDDVYDIPLMNKVGFPVTVANAHDLVKKNAKYVTTHSGGNGAVREIIDLIFTL